MESSTLKHLMGQFKKFVARPDLRPGLPEQYVKHWENQGKSGKVQIVHVQLLDQPCEITFSLFFDKEEVVQTGVRIRFKNEEIVNEVRKGDFLDYKTRQRVDPVAFLKQHYGDQTGADFLEQGAAAESFTLAVDDDSEPQVWRTVQQLTGRTPDELKDIWQQLLNTNPTRRGVDQISPIIKTWLKGQRDRLDMQFLTDVQLLQPRLQEVTGFNAHGRNYTVACRRLPGKVIRAKMDSADPEWWGGTYYRLRQDALVRVPHDDKDKLRVLRSFDTPMEFPVEEIYVETRHIYCVIFVADEALVWRTRDTINPDMPYAPPPVEGKAGKARAKAGGAAGAAVAEAAPPQPAAPAVHPFDLARVEKAYMEALMTKGPDLNDRRAEYMKLLYESDRRRFARGPEELAGEMGEVIGQALKRDAGAMQREISLVQAHVTIFYDEGRAGA